MKTQKLLSWFPHLLILGSTTALAAPIDPPTRVVLPPDAVFAPPGFDNNDEAQVTIAGSLPDTCYKAGPATAKTDVEKKIITLRNETYYLNSSWCLYVTVPFSRTIDLGTLPAGEYRVRVENADGTVTDAGNLPVAVSANGGPDDDMYAVVDEARVSGETGHRRLTLVGSLTSDCMSLKEVRILARKKNIVEVLPLVEVDRSKVCAPVLRPFETTVDLKTPWNGQSLIHVRSLNGQAVNRVVSL